MSLKKLGFLSLCIWILLLSASSRAQLSSLDRGRAEDMLNNLANDVRKHYYDPKLRGLNWDATVVEAKAKLKQVTSNGAAFATIAAALDKFGDSHTFFLPPAHAFRFEYGLQQAIVGDRCFVIRVRPGSDAETKLKPGDEILTVNGIPATRMNLWRLNYVYHVLAPQSVLHLNIQTPGGNRRQVDVQAKVTPKPRVKDLTNSVGFYDYYRDWEKEAHRFRARSHEQGAELIILRLPEFALSEDDTERLVSKARDHKTLIVDLRGNPGGRVDSLEFLLGSFFSKETKIADKRGRDEKDNKPLLAKASHAPFSGRLIVLVDAGSASAAELFARVVQIEKRGIVLGDRTAGSVMEARHYVYPGGVDTIVPYGASITAADLIMADGRSLEHTGVIPDEIILPSANDLANDRDPVLAYAAELAGAKLTPEAAKRLFPYEWPAE